MPGEAQEWDEAAVSALLAGLACIRWLGQVDWRFRVYQTALTWR